MVKLSKASKMPCKSWSLEAITTCPGSRGTNGELVPACQGCYATAGNYRFPNVKAPRQHNKQDWKRKAWVNDMVRAISADPFFRWFDSGDVYSVGLARKIHDVIARTPGTKHWLPTRSYKYEKVNKVLELINFLDHAVVRKSSDGIHGETLPGHSSTIFDPAHGAPAGAYVCPAYARQGKCGDCRACWDKSIDVIAYPQHGRNMAAANARLLKTGYRHKTDIIAAT